MSEFFNYNTCSTCKVAFKKDNDLFFSSLRCMHPVCSKCSLKGFSHKSCLRCKKFPDINQLPTTPPLEKSFMLFPDIEFKDVKKNTLKRKWEEDDWCVISFKDNGIEKTKVVDDYFPKFVSKPNLKICV